MIRRVFYLFTLLLMLGTAAKAQSADEKAIAEAGKQLNQGLITRNTKLLEMLVAPELSYGHSNGNIEDRAAFIKAIFDGHIHYISIAVSKQVIHVTGDNAVTRHIQDLKLIKDGKPTNLKIGNVLVWHKYNGKWKLTVKQGYKLQ